MANLSIRELDDDTITRLGIRAAHHHVSMEEEARRIIRQSVAPPKRLGDLALQLFGSRSGVELELPQRAPHDPLNFSS
ncbi:antitoxin FitA [Gammaproteobacteria bacterium]